MDQEIGFCTTSDGVSIAFAAIRDGDRPVVHACGWPTQLDLEWEDEQPRQFLELLARGSTLIRYDMRGSGLSERDVADFSLPVLVKDLEAVVEHLGFEQFDLVSLGMLAGPIAMTYASENPDRIRKLVLSTPFIRGNQLMTEKGVQALLQYVSNFGMPGFEFSDDTSLDTETQKDIIARQRAAAEPSVQADLLRSIYNCELSGTLDKLTMPTLVIHGKKDGIDFNQGREIAAKLPDSKFVPIDGTSSGALAYQDIRVGEIRSFLDLMESLPAATAETHTILFTDMASSTALTQQLGDAGAQEVRRAHNDIVRSALQSNGGSEIKHTGDGIMASFSSASSALGCAIAIQRGVAAHKEANPDSPLGVYVGLNAGEPIAEDDDLFGTSVDLAARICGRAEPGQILASDVVRQLAAGKDFLFSDLGETELRGFEDPVKLWELRWREEG